ncbi:MAG: hypothetical protein GX492_09855 [Firmicutes bacterium]|nr:hypothetical protein [Bacillota bacterium]
MKAVRLNIHIAMIAALLLAYITFLAPLGHAQEARQAEELSQPLPVDMASDVFPPVVTVVSPMQGATVTTGRPLIEAAFEDTSSGIDEATFHLAVDKADVTSQAIVSPWLAGLPRTSGRITYRPAVPLARGRHEVYFGVRDRAGNLAEVRWTFEVEPFFEGLKVAGRNTLKAEWYPISKSTDTLDLTVQAKVAASDVRLRLQGRGTNYPGGTPLFSYGDYNAYLDKYSLEVRHGASSVVAGYGSIPMTSEIFQVSREVRGVVASTAVRVPAGQHDISAFYGKIASSSGLGLSVYDVAGVTERWKAKSGLVLGGTYLSIGGANGYYMLGASGQARVGGRASLGFEAVYGASKDGDEAGSGVAAHFDVPFASSSLGLDLAMIQAGYPLPGTPASLSPQRGGVLRYGLRAMAKVPAKGVLNVNAALTRDNLDGTAPYTLNRANLAVAYHYPLAAGWNVRASYQGELKQSDDQPRRTVDSVSGTASVGASGQISLGTAGRLSIQGTYSAGSSEDRVSGKASRVRGISASCSAPVGSWSLSGGLDMSRKEAVDDGTRTDSAATKVTASGQIVPKVLQGTLTLFRTASDSFKEQPSAAPIQRKTEAGLETTLRLAVGKSSTVAVVFKNSWWTQEDASFKEGQNRTLNLEWVLAF